MCRMVPFVNEEIVWQRSSKGYRATDTRTGTATLPLGHGSRPASGLGKPT